MDLRNRRALKQEAAAALGAAPSEKKIIAVYTGASLLVSLILVLVNHLLDNMIAGTSGLDSLGTRTTLQTVQMVLMLAHFVAAACWDYGYLGAVMGISNRRKTDYRMLPEGFLLFGPILRLMFFQYMLLFLLILVSGYLGVQVFSFTPFVNPLVDAMLPLMEGGAATADILMNEAVIVAAQNMMLPLSCVMLLVFLLLAVPILYSYRIAGYCLLDNPRAGALRAMGGSRMLMRRNRFHLLKLDLSFFWYYLLDLAAAAVCYADQLLPLLGVNLPFGDYNYLVSFVLYIPVYFAIAYFFRNRVEVTYARAYEALKPKPPEGGIVLGNIFQM